MATPLLTGRPAEPAEGSVIRFRKFTAYSYAAIRVSGLWYITQSKRSYISAKPWDEFLDWVEPENWPSMELMH
ncbi:hypothetical protein SEA_GAUGELDP_76 [Mycobacterium phage GaugeLDP]|nr:hypothetical protein SEA_GAUGELDP_76 [Mycobacterium phage GaugeLDP]